MPHVLVAWRKCDAAMVSCEQAVLLLLSWLQVSYEQAAVDSSLMA